MPFPFFKRNSTWAPPFCMDAFGPTSGLLVTIILIGHRSRLPVLRRFAEFGSQPLTDQKDQSFHIDRVFLMHRNLDRAWRKIVIHGCLRFEIHQQAGYRAHLLRADLNRLRGRRLPAKLGFARTRGWTKRSTA